VFDVSQFKVVVQIENRFTSQSNAVTATEQEVFNVIDLIDVNFEADDESDLESLLADFGMSLADFDASIFDAE
jgi:parvulin-like peptidyl-prolyl isomerase